MHIADLNKLFNGINVLAGAAAVIPLCGSSRACSGFFIGAKPKGENRIRRPREGVGFLGRSSKLPPHQPF